MSNAAFIWDLDGTLIDSYPAIVPSTVEICAGLGVDYSADYVHDYVIRSSVRGLLTETAERLGLDPAALWAQYNVLCDSRIDRITAMPHAAEVLHALCAAGCRHFVYTHRGASSAVILERLGLAPYFTEVLTALSGFPRKPDPAAIHFLLEKYSLDPAAAYYVGDRSLDVEAAQNAGIKSILYLDPSSPGKATGRETYIVSDLLQIPDLF